MSIHWKLTSGISLHFLRALVSIEGDCADLNSVFSLKRVVNISCSYRVLSLADFSTPSCSSTFISNQDYAVHHKLFASGTFRYSSFPKQGYPTLP